MQKIATNIVLVFVLMSTFAIVQAAAPSNDASPLGFWGWLGSNEQQERTPKPFQSERPESFFTLSPVIANEDPVPSFVNAAQAPTPQDPGIDTYFVGCFHQQRLCFYLHYDAATLEIQTFEASIDPTLTDEEKTLWVKVQKDPPKPLDIETTYTFSNSFNVSASKWAMLRFTEPGDDTEQIAPPFFIAMQWSPQ